MARRPHRRQAPYRVNLEWTAQEVRALRRHLGVSQEELSRRLGMRQQTVSEWEVGKHRPRGASLTVLASIAEGAGFLYHVAPAEAAPGADQAALLDSGAHGPAR